MTLDATRELVGGARGALTPAFSRRKRERADSRRESGFAGRLLRSVSIALAGALGATGAGGARIVAAAEAGEPAVVKLSIHPAAAPIPSLRYHLTPPLNELKPGPAAPLYCKAMLLIKETPDTDWTKMIAWLNLPLDQLPRDEVEAVLKPFQAALEYVAIAAHRARCDWGIPTNEIREPWEMQLPEMQDSRQLARLLALKARLAMANGQSDAALDAVSTGLALARHVAECPLVVSGLIGQAIEKQMLEQLETFVQLRDSPNLYWSLTALPDPLIDLRPALETEGEFMNRSFPYLRDAERTQRSPEEWRNQAVQAIERIHALRRVMGAPTSAVDRPDPEAALRQLLASAPAAKAALIAAGRDRKAIDAMSDAQAVLVNAALGYHGRRDDAIKRFFFPYWQSLTLRRSETKPGAESDQGVLDFALSLLPAIEKIQVSVARRQRQLAALRTVEALRLYAAAHAGQLPSGLDALEVPAPIDPVAGAPFRYRFAEGRAEFSSDPASGEGHPPTLRYEITVAGSGK